MLLPLLLNLGMFSLGDGADLRQTRRKTRSKRPLYYSDLEAREKIDYVPAPVLAPPPTPIIPDYRELEERLSSASQELITVAQAQSRIAAKLVETKKRQQDEEETMLLMAVL